MPKIPMLDQAAVNHQRSTVHMTGAPGMNFKMDESRALINFGNTLSDFGGTIANAGNKVVSAKVKFQQELQYTEDRLAAAEDRALFKEGASALNLKLADNPGASDEEKKEWVNEFQKQYIAGRKQYTDRMSEKFRKLHDVEMLSISDSYARNRLEILTNAEVTRLQNESESLCKKACERGDFAEAERIVRENSGKLFNPEVARKLLEHDLPMRRDFYSVSKLVDLNPAQAVADLETTDKNGRYTNFINLSPDTRKQLLRYAKAKAAEQLTNEYQEICAGIVSSGKFPFTKEQMDEYHASGVWSAKKYNMINSLYEGYQKSLVQKDTQKNQAQEKQKTAMLNSIKGQIDLMEYPHPDNAAEFKLKYTEQIQKIFPKDPYRQAQAIEHLDNFLKNDPLGKTENGRMLKSYIIDTVDAMEKDEKNTMESKDLTDLRTNMLVAARKLVNDPKMTFAEASKKLDELKTAYCNKQIRSFINPFSGNLRDMSKYGKVFDSREIMDNSGANWFTRLWVPEFDDMRKSKIDKLKKEGHIDRADIVRTATATNKNGRKRTVWILKDGREVFADEYEQ